MGSRAAHPGSRAACCRSRSRSPLPTRALAGGLAYWQVVQAHALTADPLNPLGLAAARAAPRGTIYDVNGVVLARNVAGQRQRLRQYDYPYAAPVIGYEQPDLRHGRPSSGPTTRSSPAWSRSAPATSCCASSAASRTTRPTCTCRSTSTCSSVAADLLGDQQGAVVAIEPSNRAHPGPGQQPDVRPQPDRRSRRAAGATWRAPAARRLAAARPRHAGPVRARVRVQDRDLDRRSRLGRHHAPDDLCRPAGRDTTPASWSTASACTTSRAASRPIIRSTTTRRPEVSVQHLVRPRRPGHRRRQPRVDWAARLRLRRSASRSTCRRSPSQVTGGGGPYDGFRDRVELANAAYGQAEVLVTPLQMALVAATIANHGVVMQPTLVDYLKTSDGTRHPARTAAVAQVCDPQVARGSSARRCSRPSKASTASSSPARPRCPACPPRARAARPSWAAMPRRTAGSSATRRPMRQDRHRGHRRRWWRGRAARRAHGRPADERLPRRQAVARVQRSR